MSDHLARWGFGLARVWTRFYTAGARSEPRETRRRQVESDLWEHHTDRTAAGMTSGALALEVTSRTVRSIPADLAWRLGTGGIEMRSMFLVERGTGVVMLLMVLLIAAAMGGPGLSGAEPYFTEDFPEFADNPGSVFRTALWRFAVGVAALPVAALLYLTFRAHSRLGAGFGAVALVVAGVVFFVSAVVTLDLRSLAGQWVDGGRVVGDGTWFEARDRASTLEGLGFGAIVALGVSFAGFGIVIARKAVLPRAIAWPALAGVALLLVSVPLWSVGDAAWYLTMLGALSVTTSFILTAAWLTFRGTRQPPAVPGPPALPGPPA